jgi:hypothetical protein
MRYNFTDPDGMTCITYVELYGPNCTIMDFNSYFIIWASMKK